jgi:DNA topoisomerase-6 subunit B
LPNEEQAKVIRFANRVPLLYQPAACAVTKGVAATNWRNYGLKQPRNGLPEGPLIVIIHMASVWVPFTSESKEAIADYDDIRKEIQLGLKECGRKLNTFIRRKQRVAREADRRDKFHKYIGEVAQACGRMTDVDVAKLFDQLTSVAKSRTEVADQTLDEDGNYIKPAKRAGRLDGDANVIVVDREDATDEAAEPAEQGEEPGKPPKAASSTEEPTRMTA